MPRVLKADLLLENERLHRELAEMVETNRRREEEMGTSRSVRDRSRSPRRVEEIKELTYGALNLVCKLERDAYVQGLQETISKQQKEIQDLRDGEGMFGDVLLAIKRKDFPNLVDDFTVTHVGKCKRSVADTVRKLERLSMITRDVTSWGHTTFLPLSCAARDPGSAFP